MDDHDRESVFDRESDPAEEERLDAEAEASIAAGQGVPHERVREWLAKLGEGKLDPPPTA